jgi:hypothetical protein
MLSPSPSKLSDSRLLKFRIFCMQSQLLGAKIFFAGLLKLLFYAVKLVNSEKNSKCYLCLYIYGSVIQRTTYSFVMISKCYNSVVKYCYAHLIVWFLQASVVEFRLIVRDVDTFQIQNLYSCLDTIQCIEVCFFVCLVSKRYNIS